MPTANEMPWMPLRRLKAVCSSVDKASVKIIAQCLKSLITTAPHVQDLDLVGRLARGFQSTSVKAFCQRVLKLTDETCYSATVDEEGPVPRSLQRILDKKKAELDQGVSLVSGRRVFARPMKKGRVEKSPSKASVAEDVEPRMDVKHRSPANKVPCRPRRHRKKQSDVVSPAHIFPIACVV